MPGVLGSVVGGQLPATLTNALNSSTSTGLIGQYFSDLFGPWRDIIPTGNIGTFPLAASSVFSSISYPTRGDGYGFIAIGYFKPPTTGTYTFFTSSDDGSGVWIGELASQEFGRTRFNAVVDNGLGVGQGDTKRSGSIPLVANVWYAVRVVHEEGAGGDNMTFSWSGPGIAETTSLATHFKTPVNHRGQTILDYHRPKFGQVANMQATGGDVLTSGRFRTHTFTFSSTFSILQNAGPVEYFIVGGGGGGTSAGGGGGGVSSGSFIPSAGDFSVTVGAGGLGRLVAAAPSSANNGQNSQVFGFIAIGGGAAGAHDTAASAQPGGSGGGGGATSTVQTTGGLATLGLRPQGNPGGTVSSAFFVSPFPTSGGGGAASAGQGPFNASTSGPGGNGALSSVSGILRAYGGGGGGTTWSALPAAAGGSGGGGNGGVTNGSNGNFNTGGGGGGAKPGSTGGNGGNGIVIIRYPVTPQVQFSPASATGGTQTTILENGVTYRVHSFEGGPGSFNVTSVGSLNEFEFLIVGGGGAGAARHGGGGGGGGVIQGQCSLTVNNFPIVVGAGGSGRFLDARGLNGGNTSFDGRIAIGGGGGGSWGDRNGQPGGCGGGGSEISGNGGVGGRGEQPSSPWGGIGFDGAISQEVSSGHGSGGGGANGLGTRGVASIGGNGGPGFRSTILGQPYFFSGGGGGGSWEATEPRRAGNGGIGGAGGGGQARSGTSGLGGGSAINPGTNGVTGIPNASGGDGGLNTGGGGGGGGAYPPNTGWESTRGGFGGSGIVVIRYVIAEFSDPEIILN